MAQSGGDLPEDVGSAAARQLLVELSMGGCVDRTNQWLALTMMALCPSDISKVRFGTELTEFSVQTLRLLKSFFGVVFKIEKDAEANDTIMVRCSMCLREGDYPDALRRCRASGLDSRTFTNSIVDDGLTSDGQWHKSRTLWTVLLATSQRLW